jgi:dipeptidase E
VTLQVIAMGGYEIAGPSGPPSALERYLYEAAGVATPRVCCLATASGDAPEFVARFYEVSDALACEPCHLALFHDREVEDLDAFLEPVDVVYVLGGNTASMLAVWRAHGLDRTLALRAAAGDLVVGGASAGGMCWFDAGFTMSFGPLGPLHDGLGWLPGSFNPHAGQPGRLDAFEAAVAHLTLPPGWAVDDGAALHFVNGRLHHAVHAAPGARVREVGAHGARPVECVEIV